MAKRRVPLFLDDKTAAVIDALSHAQFEQFIAHVQASDSEHVGVFLRHRQGRTAQDPGPGPLRPQQPDPLQGADRTDRRLDRRVGLHQPGPDRRRRHDHRRPRPRHGGPFWSKGRRPIIAKPTQSAASLPPIKAWPADKVERRKTRDLVPCARNSRTHSKEQIEQIAASIAEWGFTNPVLIAEDGTIIAGHGRVMAAKKLGLDEVPTMMATGWSEDQKRAYVIADNKLTLNAGWDEDLLQTEFADLTASGFDVSLIGFAPGELEGIKPPAPGGIEDPPSSKYTEQYGVIVICGNEDEQQETYERFQNEGFNCRVVTT